MNFQSVHLQQALSGENVLAVRHKGDVVALRLGEVLRPPVPVEEEGAVRRQPQLLRVRLLAAEGINDVHKIFHSLDPHLL